MQDRNEHGRLMYVALAGFAGGRDIIIIDVTSKELANWAFLFSLISSMVGGTNL